MITPAAPEGPTADDLDLLDLATARLIDTVDALPDREWAAASILPGWSRSHVVAHLALNADGFRRALEGLAEDVRVPVYVSQAVRDEDIKQLAGRSPSEIRGRLVDASAAYGAALRSAPEATWFGSVDRTTGGPALAATDVPRMRHREVEIHHADLGAAYSRRDWPEAFVGLLLDAVTRDHADAGPFTVTATDLGRSWEVGGSGGPVVTAPGADLGWWLVGREEPSTLSCDSGPLPRVGPWRR